MVGSIKRAKKVDCEDTMEKQVKKFTALLSLVLVLLVFSPGSIWAEEKTDLSAPLNPAFVEYVKELNTETITGQSATGNLRGHIPIPVDRYLGDSDQLTTSEVLPAAYDLRSTGRVTAVRDQNPYGSCWAFASIASLESYLKATQSTDLSENNLMLNHGFDWGPDDGGNEGMAIAYLTRWSGPISESDDPYGSAQKSGLSPVYHVQEAEHLPNSPSVIKQALMDGGALDTSICSAAMDSDYYFNSETSALYYDGSARVDHDVAIVGWDDHYDRSNFNNQPPGDGAWIIKNSWGSNWGDGGYFYLSYYDTYAGNNITAFHNAEATNNYNRIYQYDPLGQISARGYGSNVAWGANIFTASDNEVLTAISTYTLSPDASIQINVYTNVSPDEPESGELKATKTVTVPWNGYHTISLDDAVPLTAGQRFSIVIKYTTPGYSYPIPVEEALFNYSSEATANAGQSFITSDGGYLWKDISRSDYVNVCIKGFTEAVSSSVLNSIAITTPANKLSYQVGEALDLSGLVVTGTYSDGSSKVETVTAANVTGFNSATATSSQLLTINVGGKTTTFIVQIVGSSEPGVGVFTGFLGQDPYGNYFFYNKTDFNNSYLAYQINSGMPSAKMYKHYLNNGCRIVALKDLNKGYMDYGAAASASLLAQLRGESFDINAYFGRSDASLYADTVSSVGTVDVNGVVTY